MPTKEHSQQEPIPAILLQETFDRAAPDLGEKTTRFAQELRRRLKHHCLDYYLVAKKEEGEKTTVIILPCYGVEKLPEAKTATAKDVDTIVDEIVHATPRHSISDAGPTGPHTANGLAPAQGGVKQR